MCQPVDHLGGAPRHPTYVASSTLHGRGVFAAVPIAAGDVVEECPVLRFPAAQRELVGATLIDEYYFEWDGDGAIALGLGSLYNHSDTPVAEYIKDTVNDVLVVRALSAIATGEEITFSYSGPAHPEVGPDSGT
jgi:SET domain-containing protein